MFISRCFLSGALLSALAALAGCALFSAGAWQGPSPLSGPPPPPAIQEKYEIRGGFTVLVEGPGYPPAARVVTDIGAFARARGFVGQSARSTARFDPATHQPLPPAPERYFLGQVVLDVTYQPDEFRVYAYLHSARLGQKFVEDFYHDFDRQYAGHYGVENPIVESEYTGAPSGPFRGSAR